MVRTVVRPSAHAAPVVARVRLAPYEARRALVPATPLPSIHPAAAGKGRVVEPFVRYRHQGGVVFDFAGFHVHAEPAIELREFAQPSAGWGKSTDRQRSHVRAITDQVTGCGDWPLVLVRTGGLP